MPKTSKETLYKILKRPKEIKYQLCSINSQIESLQTCLLPSAIRYDEDKVQTSPSDKLSGIEAEIDRLEREHKSIEDDLPRSTERIAELCNDLDELEGTVIMMRCVACQTFDQIGVALNYDKSNAWRIYDRALKKLEKKFE